MNQRRDNHKNALQINLTSRQQAESYNQMEATWAADHTPLVSIKITKLVSWLVRFRGRFTLVSNQSAGDCQSVCDCQTACECG